jgi:hypothetical protein
MATRQIGPAPKPGSHTALYGHDNFEQIADAIGVDAEEIRKHATLLEGAARWYRLDRNRPDRAAPSISRRKLDQIAKQAAGF